MLILVGVLLLCVVAAATQVQPYYPDGTPKRSGSHESLGLPPCTYKYLFNSPCPSCGMTTSFALFIRGDIANSLRANFIGTGLIILVLLIIPWAFISAWRGKYLWIRRADLAFALLFGLISVCILIRWGIQMLLTIP
ncbi:MAG: DUF2752 domain-containing protein [Zavarzinella sp.]